MHRRKRVRAGLQLVGVPSSERTRQEAEKYGVPLTTFDKAPIAWALPLTNKP